MVAGLLEEIGSRVWRPALAWIVVGMSLGQLAIALGWVHSYVSTPDVHGLAVVEPPNGRKVLLATTNRGLHRSEDNGETWTLQEIPSPWPYTRSIVPRADNAGVVFLTNGNGPPGNDGFLLRSRDYGRTWEDAKLPGPLESTVWCVATDAASGGRTSEPGTDGAGFVFDTRGGEIDSDRRR